MRAPGYRRLHEGLRVPLRHQSSEMLLLRYSLPAALDLQALEAWAGQHPLLKWMWEKWRHLWYLMSLAVVMQAYLGTHRRSPAPE